MVVGSVERTPTRLEGEGLSTSDNPFWVLMILNIREEEVLVYSLLAYIKHVWLALQKLHDLRLERLEAGKSPDEVLPVDNVYSLWDDLKGRAQSLFSAGLSPEVVIGRTAMLGFLSATTVEFETGKSVLQQLTFRFVPADLLKCAYV
jgi:hypothetical protein